jgi:putative membrane protein
MTWKWMIVTILLLLLVIFSVQNYEMVQVRFLLWSFTTSRALVIFGTLVIGMIIGWLGFYIWEKNR